MKLEAVYAIGIIGTILFMVSYLPDTMKAIKSKEIKGVTVSSSLVTIFALGCAITSNVYFKNWPFVVNDVVCIAFCTIILINRIRKITN